MTSTTATLAAGPKPAGTTTTRPRNKSQNCSTYDPPSRARRCLVAVEAADIDKHLNEIERRLTEPTLVTLRNGEATMHIGLGNPDHSIALFCDDSGQSWASRGNETTIHLAFRKGGHRHEFYPSRAIPPARARSAANEFAATNRRPTATINWEREPNQGDG